MTAYFYKNIPEYQLKMFCAVRDVFDNLLNVLNVAEIINTSSHCRIPQYEHDFNFAIFSGEYSRILIRKDDGFYSMATPFQLLDHGDRVTFYCNFAREDVSGQYISIMRNAIKTSKMADFSHEDILLSISESFGIGLGEALSYLDTFLSLAIEDHGYFRFDDDPGNENGKFHPRYHFDIFYKNSSAIKIGTERHVDINCFYALFDPKFHKPYFSGM